MEVVVMVEIRLRGINIREACCGAYKYSSGLGSRVEHTGDSRVGGAHWGTQAAWHWQMQR